MNVQRVLLLAAVWLLIYPNQAATQRSKQAQSDAIEDLLKAAEQGDSLIHCMLGYAYMRGRPGALPDYAEAAKWFLRAAEQGNINAQYNVGQMYAEGKGILQDYIQACRWLTLSTSTRGQNPIFKKTTDLLDSVTRKMTPPQIAEAQRLVKEWESGYVEKTGDSPLVAGSWGVTDPVVLVNPPPPYASEARTARAEGLVQVQCVVRKSGRVDNCRIIRGLGYGLDKSAINTITKYWRFNPGLYEGKPVDMRAVFETVFHLH